MLNGERMSVTVCVCGGGGGDFVVCVCLNAPLWQTERDRERGSERGQRAREFAQPQSPWRCVREELYPSPLWEYDSE